VISSLGRPVDLRRDVILHRDLSAGLVVAVLRRGYPREKLVAVAYELARVLGFTVAEGGSPPVAETNGEAGPEDGYPSGRRGRQRGSCRPYPGA